MLSIFCYFHFKSNVFATIQPNTNKNRNTYSQIQILRKLQFLKIKISTNADKHTRNELVEFKIQCSHLAFVSSVSFSFLGICSVKERRRKPRQCNGYFIYFVFTLIFFPFCARRTWREPVAGISLNSVGSVFPNRLGPMWSPLQIDRWIKMLRPNLAPIVNFILGLESQ